LVWIEAKALKDLGYNFMIDTLCHI